MTRPARHAAAIFFGNFPALRSPSTAFPREKRAEADRFGRHTLRVTRTLRIRFGISEAACTFPALSCALCRHARQPPIIGRLKSALRSAVPSRFVHNPPRDWHDESLSPRQVGYKSTLIALRVFMERKKRRGSRAISPRMRHRHLRPFCAWCSRYRDAGAATTFHLLS